MTVARWLIVSLQLVGGIGGVTGIAMLVAQSRTMSRLRRDPARHVIDGGDVNGNPIGRNASTVMDELLDAGRIRWWIIVVLIVSLGAGLVANLLPSTSASSVCRDDEAPAQEPTA